MEKWSVLTGQKETGFLKWRVRIDSREGLAGAAGRAQGCLEKAGSNPGLVLGPVKMALSVHPSLPPTPHIHACQTTLTCLDAGRQTHFTTSLGTAEAGTQR